MKHQAKNIILFGSGVAGGMAAGYLLASVQRNKSSELIPAKMEALLNKLLQISFKLKQKSGRSMQRVSEIIKHEFNEPIPDLFKATESLSLNDEDILNG